METNQTQLLLKRTLARLKESQVIVGTAFTLFCLFALFLIGTVGNVLLFLQIKNYRLISNKLHLLNLVLCNLLVLDIVVPSNFFEIIQAKCRRNTQMTLQSAGKSSLSLYNQMVRAEDCESESSLTLIAFYCHLFNFLIFFTVHLKIVHKTKFFYLNWFRLRTAFGHGQTAKSNEPLNRNEFSNQTLNRASNEIASNHYELSADAPSTSDINRPSNDRKTLSNESRALSNDSQSTPANGRPKDLNDICKLLDELQSNQLSLSASLNYLTSQQVACQQVVNRRTQRTKSDLAAKFTGQTIADLILIRIRNFVLCFLSAWTFALTLAVLNDLSHEQFSACSHRYRLCATWFQDLISSENYDPTVRSDRSALIGGDRPFSPVNGGRSAHNLLDKFSRFGNRTTSAQLLDRLGNATAGDELLGRSPNDRPANESEFQNQTTAQLAGDDAIAPHYLSNLLSKIERYQSAPSVHYTILIIEFVVIFAATLFTIANLVSTFLDNRAYRIVPQCSAYVVETNRTTSVSNVRLPIDENKHELANPGDERGKRCSATDHCDPPYNADTDNKIRNLDGRNDEDGEYCWWPQWSWLGYLSGTPALIAVSTAVNSVSLLANLSNSILQAKSKVNARLV